jgi:hypothetical protein
MARPDANLLFEPDGLGERKELRVRLSQLLALLAVETHAAGLAGGTTDIQRLAGEPSTCVRCLCYWG